MTFTATRDSSPPHPPPAIHHYHRYHDYLPCSEQQNQENYDQILQLQLYLERVARRGGDTDTDAGIEWGRQVNEVVGKVIALLEALAERERNGRGFE